MLSLRAPWRTRHPNNKQDWTRCCDGCREISLTKHIMVQHMDHNEMERRSCHRRRRTVERVVAVGVACSGPQQPKSLPVPKESQRPRRRSLFVDDDRWRRDRQVARRPRAHQSRATGLWWDEGNRQDCSSDRVAALNVGGDTLHAIAAAGRGFDDKDRNEATVALAKQYIKRMRVLVIDEVSMLSASYLAHWIRRLERLAERTFGVVLLGDFLQLQPVSVGNIETLYACVLTNESPASAKPDKMALHAQGRELMKTFRRLLFRTQQRAKGDKEHSEILQEMRDELRFTDRILRYITARKLTFAEVTANPAWASAPMLVGTNLDRQRANAMLLTSWARRTGRPVVTWHRKITTHSIKDKAAAWVQARFHEALTAYFVVGAPAMVTTNIDKPRGLVNGAACRFVGLLYNDEQEQAKYNALTAEAMADIATAVAEGGVSEGVVLHLATPPDLITVMMQQDGAVHDLATESDEFDVDRAELIAAMTMGGGLPELTQHATSAPAIESAGGGRGRGRGKGKTNAVGLNQILKQKKQQIAFERHIVEPACALTFHKVQGSTHDNVIVAVRRGNGRLYTFESMYVAISRVRSGAGLRSSLTMTSSTKSSGI